MHNLQRRLYNLNYFSCYVTDAYNNQDFLMAIFTNKYTYPSYVFAAQTGLNTFLHW